MSLNADITAIIIAFFFSFFFIDSHLKQSNRGIIMMYESESMLVTDRPVAVPALTKVAFLVTF